MKPYSQRFISAADSYKIISYNENAPDKKQDLTRPMTLKGVRGQLSRFLSIEKKDQRLRSEDNLYYCYCDGEYYTVIDERGKGQIIMQSAKDKLKSYYKIVAA